MTPVQLKWLMIAIIVVFYLFDTFLELLNLKYHTTDLPPESTGDLREQEICSIAAFTKRQTPFFHYLRPLLLCCWQFLCWLLTDFAYLILSRASFQ